MKDKKWAVVKAFIENSSTKMVDAADWEFQSAVDALYPRVARNNEQRAARLLKRYYARGLLSRSLSGLHLNGYAAIRYTRRYVYELTEKGKAT